MHTSQLVPQEQALTTRYQTLKARRLTLDLTRGKPTQANSISPMPWMVSSRGATTLTAWICVITTVWMACSAPSNLAPNCRGASRPCPCRRQ